MASVKRRGDALRVQLRPEERMVLARLARQVVELLELPEEPATRDVDPLVALTGLGSGGSERPEDPALQRLFPDAYDDPAQAAEFRRLTDEDLRRGKAAALTQLADEVDAADGALELTSEQGGGWVQAINDVRLVLGVRLEVDDDEGEWRGRYDADDPRLALVAAYDWLSMLQELLLDALS